MSDTIAPQGNQKLSDNELADKYFKMSKSGALIPVKATSLPGGIEAGTTGPNDLAQGQVISSAGTQPEKSEPKPSALAAKVAADREARMARMTGQQDATNWKERAEAAEAKLKALQMKDIVVDPRGHFDEMGLDKDEQINLAETLLYSHAPDQANAEIKIKLLEARQAREKKLQSKKEQEAQQRAEESKRAQLQEDFVAGLEAAAMHMHAGSYPDCESWFGDDHQSFIASLYATANNMVERAQALRQPADLRFEAVAAELEKDIGGRYQRATHRFSAVKPDASEAAKPVQTEQKTEPVVTPKVEAVDTNGISTKGLGGTGQPRPPARTVEERLARAAEVVFATKT